MAEPSQERLDQLDETITSARTSAEQDGLVPEEDGPTLLDPDNDGDADPEGMENAPG
jgi:hypothetical protein